MASGEFSMGPHGAKIAAAVSARAAIEVEAIASLQYHSLKAEGKGSAAIYAEAGARGEVAVGDDGASIAVGAHAGAGYQAGGEVTVGAAGVSVTVGASVSYGLQAGFDGDAHATYKDGVISFGMSGDIALIFGIKFDFNIEIDIGAFIDAVEDVVDFFANDVADFFTEDVANFFENDFVDFFENDVVDFFEDVGSALNPSNWW
jgi:hypothetical protein